MFSPSLICWALHELVTSMLGVTKPRKIRFISKGLGAISGVPPPLGNFYFSGGGDSGWMQGYELKLALEFRSLQSLKSSVCFWVQHLRPGREQK